MTKWNLDFRVLEGKKVRLEPPCEGHIDQLCESLLGEKDGWYATRWGMESPAYIATIISNLIKSNAERTTLSFVIRDLVSGKAAGVSSFHNIVERKRQLEIGMTQIGPKFRRTHVNTEAKYLMLREAFETLGTIRVYFKVDSGNLISQRAVRRIGATYEGSLRNDNLLPSGEPCNMHVYSILDSEWPAVKSSFDQRMGSDYSRPYESLAT